MHIKDLIPWARKPTNAEPPGEGDAHPVAALQRDINTVFDSFWSRIDTPVWGERFGGSFGRADVVDMDDAVEVSIELPGMEPADIDVSVAEDMMTIRGEKRVERNNDRQGYYLSERSYGAVYRTIPLPPGVDGEKAEATFRNGVLTVRVPRTPQALEKVRKVEIRSA